MVAIPLAFFTLKIKLIYCLILLALKMQAQELLRNPSFETNCFCNIPNMITLTKFLCAQWDTNIDTTNQYYSMKGSYYFNQCNNDSSCNGNNTHIPNSAYGDEEAHFGQAYVGIYTYISPIIVNPNYTLYLTQKLDNYLFEKAKYDFTFYISLADNFNHNNNSLQVLFNSHVPFFLNPPQNNSTSSEDFHPQLDFQALGYQLNVKNGWQQIIGSYAANGSEDRITIGNFKFSNHSDTVYNGTGQDTGYCGYWWSGSFYFIDDVSLTLGIDAGKDTIICTTANNNLQLKASVGWQHYTWATLAGNVVGNTQNININTPGTYIVTGTVDSLPNYSKIDTVIISAAPINNELYSAHAPTDTIVCPNTTTLLTAINPSQNLTYQWSNGSTAPTTTVTDSGTYSLQIYSGNCYKKEYTTVGYYPTNQNLLDSATLHLTNLQNTITANSGFTNYEWSSGETTQSITISAPPLGGGWVGLSAYTQEGCLVTDTVQIIYTELPIIVPTIFSKLKDKEYKILNLPQGASVTIYNVLGQSLPNPTQGGAFNILHECAAGIYFIRLRLSPLSGELEKSFKIVVLE